MYTRNTPQQETRVNGVSHQGHDHGISSVIERMRVCGIEVTRTSSPREPGPLVVESPAHRHSNQDVCQDEGAHPDERKPLSSR
jgi:hypothetical protein